MCDHCHRSCCYCGPCYPRRCVSCTAICRCEPCSTASCCCHCCWTTCPCCCRRTCRSHSLGGVPFKQSSDDNEIKLKKISGYYLKMQNKSISDLYKNTSPTSKSSRMRGRRGERQSEEHHKQTICKSHDHLRHLMETPIFSPRLLAALEECAPIEACDSYADFVGVPFTYYPKFVIAGYYPPTCKKSAHGEHLDALKLRLLSRKNIGSCERRDLFDKNLLNDFNKLYATVGGGMVQTEMGTLEPMPTQMPQQQQEITTPHAIEEYRAFFGSRRHKRRGHSRTSKPRRLSPQRKRFSARRMRGISGQNSEVIRSENYLDETDSFQAQYQPQLGSTDGNVSSQRPSQQRDFSDANGSSEVLRSEFDHNETDGFRPTHQRHHDFTDADGSHSSQHHQRDFDDSTGASGSKQQQQQHDLHDSNGPSGSQHQQRDFNDSNGPSGSQHQQHDFNSSNGHSTSHHQQGDDLNRSDLNDRNRSSRSQYQQTDLDDRNRSSRSQYQQTDLDDRNRSSHSQYQPTNLDDRNRSSQSQYQQTDVNDGKGSSRRLQKQPGVGSSHSQHHKLGFKKPKRPVDSLSNYVFGYPTRLKAENRARLSAKQENREDLFGSRIFTDRASGRLESFQKRHIIDLGRTSKLRSSNA